MDGLPAYLVDAVAAPQRSLRDRRRDADRRPAHVLAFFGLRPGMEVAELMAGGGYYVDILARAVGPEGVVHVQNSPYVLQRFAEKPLSKRLARLEADGIHNLVRHDRPLEDPGLPLGGLDLVLLNRFYHDTYWQEVDRPAMLRAIYDALEPGGVFGVVDHRARDGVGSRDAERLHRIDEALVEKEILAAGFVLDAESDLLHHPEDTRDWSIFADDSARRDRTDRFVLRFRKPLKP